MFCRPITIFSFFYWLLLLVSGFLVYLVIYVQVIILLNYL